MSTIQSGATRKEVSTGSITLDHIKDGEYQKPGTTTAQVRQVVTTTSFYPSKKTENDMQGGLFSSEEFGFSEQEFTAQEERVAWIQVPSGTPAEAVMQRLEKAEANGARIYRVLSNEPILTEDQKYAITAGLRTKDHYADQQVVRYPDNHADTPGELILHGGLPQYRRTFFWATNMDDIDNRGKSEVYFSAEIKAELEGAATMPGQTIATANTNQPVTATV